MTSFNPLTTNFSQKSLVRSNYINIIGKIGSLNVLEACLVENYNNKLIINLGAVDHICYSLEWFKQSSLLNKGQRSLKLGNKEFLRSGSRTCGVMF